MARSTGHSRPVIKDVARLAGVSAPTVSRYLNGTVKVSEETRARIAKAIEELREGLEARGLLYILEPDDDKADDEDLSQLLNMVFSPDADSDVMLGSAAPSSHHYDDELIGASPKDGDEKKSGVINEGLDSLDDLLSQVSKHDGSDDEDSILASSPYHTFAKGRAPSGVPALFWSKGPVQPSDVLD